MTPSELIVIAACLAAGGILKGATGAGAPILAIPALATVFDVRFAVVVMVVPNLLTNLWQAWRFRDALAPGGFALVFAAAGAVGVTLGTFILAILSQDSLSVIVSCSVLGYVVFRLTHPDWHLPASLGRRLAVPAGFTGGLLQGASGISAPVSISFLNALGLDRRTFIATISVFFAMMSVCQIPALAWFGLVTGHSIALSLLAVLPIVLFMPVGSVIARRLSKQAFDRIILLLLVGLAAKLLIDAVMG